MAYTKSSATPSVNQNLQERLDWIEEGVSNLAVGGAGVNSVSAGDASITIGGTASDPAVATGTLDVIATTHPPAFDWDNNGKKITGIADPASSQDAATKNYVDSATFNNQSGTTYTLVLADQGKTVNFTGASAATLTIPPSSSVAFSTSPAAVVYVAQGGTGGVTIAAGAGVTLVNPYNSFVIAARYGEVKLTKIGTDTWRLNGEVL